MSRELDAVIASALMGLDEVEFIGERLQFHNPILDKELGGNWRSPVPCYSTNIFAAMEVVEKIRTFGKRTTFTNTTGKPKGPAHWFVEIDDGNCASEVVADADTLPEAICRAALAAIGLPLLEKET